VHRLDAGQGEAVPGCPREEIRHGFGVGPPRVGIVDSGNEELDEAACRVVARLGDDHRQDRSAAGGRNARL